MFMVYPLSKFDARYPDNIRLHVDASDVARMI
ncbi:hypothetical protein EHW99_1200 [Erwinia amylovora]|uniref:Uncharacterized protein n=1 Tax=Erwinia amylovora (strain CFBP1430) TaxID=665029 RepID=D4HXF0_ERWAC|nr:hypothetical protein EaACW_2412 [Erwinia amylovora ACW56400]QJQ53906.1 hypothetical protein EHX00_1200 [Erwinia amylovora]CBA21635.1 hypothetical protein predicted by Glimmer/Critica [Erwinia amylovora CFBP1430]CCO90620.1 hypothetical protein BN435_2461 [Erwinia amylovora 01SFR-BO]QJQ57604.1 hypothetical protein EHW99_1200 [Erwinia amylovora]